MARTKEDEQPVHAETAAEDITVLTETIKAQGETILFREREIESLHTTIAKKNETIASLEESFKAQGETIDALQGQLDTLHGDLNEAKRDLGMARLANQAKASSAPTGIERLPGGGIRFPVELDVDESAPLLSWADSAGEDPLVYIQRQIHDAMVMVVSS
jgi:uncharacterized coiled-coil protein SlyX